MDCAWYVARLVLERQGMLVRNARSKTEADIFEILPWDWDLDTQVSDHGLRTLAESHNGTTHRYPSSNGRSERRYLLDVNAWAWQREQGDGANVRDMVCIAVIPLCGANDSSRRSSMHATSAWTLGFSLT